MKVELGSHTDDRGTEPYNLKLSQSRAKSAVDYIVSKGIDPSRIKGTGYGKTQLIHKGVGGKRCTPEENRENRRTEIFIPGFLRGEQVRQERGDYSNGKPDASKDYSSKKEHGSIFEEVPASVQKQKDETAPKIVPVPKVEKVEKTQKKTPVPVGSTSENDVKVPAVNNPATEPVRYYVVLGSFKEKSTALKFVQQLNTEGYPAIIYSESEPIRVGIGYPRYSAAKEQLEILKNKYNGAWLLKK